MSRWLHLAAAPSFMMMALATAAPDGGVPLCTAGGSFALSGMAPMYLLMAIFHSAPWLKLISQRGGVTLFAAPNRSGDIQTMEQKS